MQMLVLAGPKQNPETYPVAKIAQAMWSDSEADAIEYLHKAGLEPEQASSGSWHLVLHRALKVDPQAASFRQRSARLCNQQDPVRSRNVVKQGRQAEAALQALLAGSSRQLPQLEGAVGEAMGSGAGLQQSVAEAPLAQPQQVGLQHCVCMCGLQAVFCAWACIMTATWW